MKIVLASDNHRDPKPLMRIAGIHNDADYYWHLGDSEEMDSDLLRPFISVRGNCDYNRSLPLERIFEVGGHRVMMMHGHLYYDGTITAMSYRAEEEGCDILLYGHTHVFADDVIGNVRCINPGSCRVPRDSDTPTYAIIEIDKENNVKVIKKELTK